MSDVLNGDIVMQNHVPVMLNEVCEILPEKAKIVFDGTLGHGGHTFYMAQKLKETNGDDFMIIGVDVDEKMLRQAEKKVEPYHDNVRCIKASYSDIDVVLSALGIQKVDYFLLDLGVNMSHFQDIERGFSVRGDAKLDMRFDQQSDYSAYDFVNSKSLEYMTKVFMEYADFTETKSREIAHKITSTRRHKKIDTTFQLKEILSECGLGQKASIVIFQAIRIDVNGEMDNLKRFLDKFYKYLNVGGRCNIMTYHSIEDRIVKKAFLELAKQEDLKLYNKKVLKPSYKEVQKNRASRSAKMRVIQKII